MSTSPSLDLQFARKTGALEIVRILLDTGWSIDDHGSISYLKLGDTGDFNWASAPLTRQPEIETTIAAKEASGETPGIVLLHTGSGGEFLFWQDRQSASLIASANTRYLPNLPRVGDANWYIKHVAVPLMAAGVPVTSITWNNFLE